MNTYDFITTVDNGWYSFSISGHAFYSKSDTIKIHGKKAFLNYLKKNHKSALVKPLCYGDSKLINYREF